MSTVSATVHNFEDLLAGKTDFAGFKAAELQLIKENIASLSPVIQPSVQIVADSFAAAASSLVGAGETAIGAIINQSADTQATMVLNGMQALGIPTTGPLSIAERAALVAFFNGLKAYLDRMHISFATQGAQPAAN